VQIAALPALVLVERGIRGEVDFFQAQELTACVLLAVKEFEAELQKV
jgi:hypothetical protein